MPTYQYRCTECRDELEVVQKFSDEPLTVCPACQGSLRKVFSPVGIVFKGSGFYRTDSRNGSSGDGTKKKDKEPAAGKPAESADAGKSSAKESAGSADSSSGSSSGSAGSSGSSSSGKSGKSSSSAAPAASTAG